MPFHYFYPFSSKLRYMNIYCFHNDEKAVNAYADERCVRVESGRPIFRFIYWYHYMTTVRASLTATVKRKIIKWTGLFIG